MAVQKFKKDSKVQLTSNFNLSEMDCHCKYPECKETLVSMTHMRKLQEFRVKIGKSIEITSGYRCPRYNKEVGGASASRHPQGDATDIQVKDMTPAEVQDKCEHFDGLGRYKDFTHVDSRGSKARWGIAPSTPETKAKQEYLSDGPSSNDINEKLETIEKLVKETRNK